MKSLYRDSNSSVPQRRNWRLALNFCRYSTLNLSAGCSDYLLAFRSRKPVLIIHSGPPVTKHLTREICSTSHYGKEKILGHWRPVLRDSEARGTCGGSYYGSGFFHAVYLPSLEVGPWRCSFGSFHWRAHVTLPFHTKVRNKLVC